MIFLWISRDHWVPWACEMSGIGGWRVLGSQGTLGLELLGSLRTLGLELAGRKIIGTIMVIIMAFFGLCMSKRGSIGPQKNQLRGAPRSIKNHVYQKSARSPCHVVVIFFCRFGVHWNNFLNMFAFFRDSFLGSHKNTWRTSDLSSSFFFVGGDTFSRKLMNNWTVMNSSIHFILRKLNLTFSKLTKVFTQIRGHSLSL